MLKVSRAGVGENDDDKIELSLDLSIGGSYGKSQKLIEEDKGVPSKNDKSGEEFMVQRSGFSFSETSGNELESRSGSESADSKRKKEIQALRRQEARRKRDEKIKKSTNSRGVPNGSAFCFGVANADDKLQLKIQQLKAKARERETRENEGALLETARKKEEVDQIVDDHLGKESMQEEQSNGSEIGSQKAMSNGNLERNSSLVSDHRSTSERGGIGNKIRSNSKCSKANELLSRASASSDGLDKRDDNDASPNPGERNYATRMRGEQPLIKCLSTESQYSSIEAADSNRPIAPPCKASKTTPTSEASSIVKPKSEVVNNTPTLQGGNHGMASLAAMPCVSTTGTGPDGKTITGFLYRYSKTDVCIVCVCHGKSHTPAEFVEHAGGIGVTHPLRHITMMPSSFE